MLFFFFQNNIYFVKDILFSIVIISFVIRIFPSYFCRGKIDFACRTNSLQQKKHSTILRYSLNADLEDAYYPPWILLDSCILYTNIDERNAQSRT